MISPPRGEGAEIRLCAQCGKAILIGEPHRSRLAGSDVLHEHYECSSAAEDFRATRLSPDAADLQLLQDALVSVDDVTWVIEHHRLVATRLGWAWTREAK